MAKPHNHNEKQKRTIEIESALIDKKTSYLTRAFDVAPCGACRPWIFFINGVIFFLKFNSSGMKKEER